MDDDLKVIPGVVIPHWELVFTASRSSGPGGQHANKTSSRITLHWSVESTTALSDQQRWRVKTSLASRLTDDGALQLHVEDSRSQHRNKELARERLVEVLKKALFVPKKRRVTKPSKASKKRRVDTKKARAGVKSMRKKPTSDS